MPPTSGFSRVVHTVRRCANDHYAQVRKTQILLVLKTSIHSYQGIEALASPPKQVAVLCPGPTLGLHSTDIVSNQFRNESARQILVKQNEHWPERSRGPNPVRLALVLWTPMGTDRRTGRPSLHPLGNRRATEPARAYRGIPVCRLIYPDRYAQPGVIQSAYGQHNLPTSRILRRSHRQPRAADSRSLWTTAHGDRI